MTRRRAAATGLVPSQGKASAGNKGARQPALGRPKPANPPRGDASAASKGAK